MSRSARVSCGVPEDRCVGSFTKTSNKYAGSKKSHSSHAEARSCYVKYLLSLGYRQVTDNPAHYQLGDGPIVVVTKISRFGARLRQGKEKRFMPAQRTSGRVVGL